MELKQTPSFYSWKSGAQENKGVCLVSSSELVNEMRPSTMGSDASKLTFVFLLLVQFAPFLVVVWVQIPKVLMAGEPSWSCPSCICGLFGPSSWSGKGYPCCSNALNIIYVNGFVHHKIDSM